MWVGIGFASPASGDQCPTGRTTPFILLTTAPGPDVAPIHDRQMIVLERDDRAAWLDLTRSEAALPRPLPAGALLAEQVR
jgi:putative SOS response-associated peptidase YedK